MAVKTVTWWVTVVTMISVTVGLIAWDIYVATNKTDGDTISEILQYIALHHPLVPFAFGVLGGHFFWPGTTPLTWQWQIAILTCLGGAMFGIDLLHEFYPTRVLNFMFEYPILFAVMGVPVGRFVWPLPPL